MAPRKKSISTENNCGVVNEVMDIYFPSVFFAMHYNVERMYIPMGMYAGKQVRLLYDDRELCNKCEIIDDDGHKKEVKAGPWMSLTHGFPLIKTMASALYNYYNYYEQTPRRIPNAIVSLYDAFRLGIPGGYIAPGSSLPKINGEDVNGVYISKVVRDYSTTNCMYITIDGETTVLCTIEETQRIHIMPLEIYPYSKYILDTNAKMSPWLNSDPKETMNASESRIQPNTGNLSFGMPSFTPFGGFGTTLPFGHQSFTFSMPDGTIDAVLFDLGKVITKDKILGVLPLDLKYGFELGLKIAAVPNIKLLECPMRETTLVKIIDQQKFPSIMLEEYKCVNIVTNKEYIVTNSPNEPFVALFAIQETDAKVHTSLVKDSRFVKLTDKYLPDSQKPEAKESEETNSVENQLVDVLTRLDTIIELIKAKRQRGVKSESKS